MKKKESEATIQLNILKSLRKNNVLCWRTQSQGSYQPKLGIYVPSVYAMKGVADILGVMPDGTGRILAVEVKTTKGVQSADQILFERRLRRAGGVYILARSIEDVECVFDGSF